MGYRKRFISQILILFYVINLFSFVPQAIASIAAPGNLRAIPGSDNTSVQLNWKWVADASGYKIYQSSNGTSYTEIDQVEGSRVSYTVSNLTAYGTYYFAVTAIKDEEESSRATARIVLDSDLPTDPTNLTATSTMNSITLNWSASTDASGSVKYQIYFRQNAAEYSLLSTVDTNRYTASGLTPGATYSFYVYAIDNAENRSANRTNTVMVDTLADTQAPSAPTGLSATFTGTNSVEITWNVSTDNIGLDSYELYRSTTNSADSSFTRIATPTTNSFTNTGVTSSATYYYKVRAKDTSGNFSAFSPVVTAQWDSQKPTPPRIWAQAVSKTKVNLTWSGATDNKGVTGYDIYRAAGTSTSFTKLNSSNVTGSSYEDTTVLADRVYKYYIRAKDAAGNVSDNSNTVNVTTNGDTTKPSAPQNLSLSLISRSEVKLTWNASTDNTNVTGYNIYRALESGSYECVASVTGTSHNDRNLTENKAYKYYIRAYDAAGNESNASTTENIYTHSMGSDVERTITASQGGVLEVTDLVKLDIPRDATNNNTTYKMVVRSFSSYSTTGFKSLGLPVEITAKSGTANITSFNKDLTLTFYYTSSELGSVSTNKLSVYYWDTSNKIWVRMPSTVNTSSRTVTAKTNHFTVFALLADNEAPEVPTLSNNSNSVKRIIKLTGKAEKGSKVNIMFNGSSNIVNVDSKGDFSQEVMLTIGRNDIRLRAEDNAGNQSEWSSTYYIQCTPNYVYNDIMGHWAEYNIQKLLDMDISSGYDDEWFRPNQTITRAEFARFVVASLGLSPVSNPKLNFKDSKDIPSWAAGYVARAVEKGIISGYSDNTFRASRHITRQEMASMLVRAMQLQEQAVARQNRSLNFIDDDKIAAWARGSVAVVVEKGIIKGYPDNSFGPARNATRAEAITMIVKMLEVK